MLPCPSQEVENVASDGRSSGSTAHILFNYVILTARENLKGGVGTAVVVLTAIWDKCHGAISTNLVKVNSMWFYLIAPPISPA